MRDDRTTHAPHDGAAAPPPRDGVSVRPLRGDAELRAAVALQRAVWGRDFADVVPRSLLWAVQRVGGVAAGAFAERSGELLGIVFGITGFLHGRPVHWSDVLAVRPAARGRGISIALKTWQRAALLRAGVEHVAWTFEPLESRNAHINFARLGVLASEYLRDAYGVSASPLHAGIGTDRLVADWQLASERVARRLDGRERAPTAAEAAALPRINIVQLIGELPSSREPDLTLAAARVRLAIPADIQRIGQHSPELAGDWRRHTRVAFEAYLARGYRVEELVRVGETSDYVLARA